MKTRIFTLFLSICMIIPTNIDGYAPVLSFDASLGKDVWNIYAYIDNALTYVPIKTDEVYPAIIENDCVTDSYVGKICTYSIDSDGLYTITSLGYNEKPDGNYDGLVKDVYDFKEGEGLDNDTDENIQFYAEGFETDFTMITYKRFIPDGLDTNASFRYIILTPFTKIIIRNHKVAKDEYEFLEYDADTFLGDVTLTNVSMVVSNDIDSTSRNRNDRCCLGLQGLCVCGYDKQGSPCDGGKQQHNAVGL